ncbi:MAG: Crp/Fnr family transcriptional regulator [Prevotella sp.]|nr:Crp/Fnr family transcriptional regulator [Prevotella sp.]
MSTLHLYDKLLQFTLFQGMSHADLMEVVTHTKIGFHKYPAGKRLINAGDPCNRLTFLINGILQTERYGDNKAYSVTERLSAPHLPEPERLFGIRQIYKCTYTTLTDVNLITIDKQEVMLLLETQLVFRLNMLNLMATEIQRLARHPWRTSPKSLRDRIIYFFFTHCQYPAGPKTFYILMQQLADQLNDSRLDVSQVLNQLQEEGLLSLYRGRIEIPMLERLLM